jgi:hypothetical protein
MAWQHATSRTQTYACIFSGLSTWIRPMGQLYQWVARRPHGYATQQIKSRLIDKSALDVYRAASENLFLW